MASRTVVALVLRSVQVVRLVDEENAAHRSLQDLPGLGRGVTDVLTDQVVARNAHQVALPGVTEAVKDLCHPLRHRRLAGARASCEAHVQRRLFRGQTGFATEAIDDEQGGNLAHSGLYGCEPDELPVESVDHLADVGSTAGIGASPTGWQRRRHPASGGARYRASVPVAPVAVA